MKGSIRTIAGLILTMGATGGIENGSALLPCIALAAAGLATMASGVKAMKG